MAYPKPGDPCITRRHRRMHAVNAHIIPKFRGGGNGQNIHKGRCGGCEGAYHTLFGVMTPEEVIEHLVRAFWNNDDSHVYAYIDSRDGDTRGSHV